MRTVIIYDGQAGLDEISFFLAESGAEILGIFPSSSEGYDFIMKERPDAVFINMQHPVDGIDCGVRIRKNCPDALIVYFGTQQRVYKPVPRDYILVPADENGLSAAANYIKNGHIMQQQEKSDKPIITCFGQFKVQIKNEEIKFPTQKVRELLAYLICHYEKPFFRDDLIRSLFQSGNQKKDITNFRVTLFRLRHAFKDNGIKKEHILINENCSINVAPGICDLIDFFDFMQKNKVINHTNILAVRNIIDRFEGELFSDLDTLWVDDKREIIMIQIENLMLNAAQYYISTGRDYQNAELLLTRLLDMNNLSESGYAMLLDIYIHTAENSKYIYLFRRYAKIMKTEFGSAPDRKYVRYYVNLDRQ